MRSNLASRIGLGSNNEYVALDEAPTVTGRNHSQIAFDEECTVHRPPKRRRLSLLACCALSGLIVLAFLFALNATVFKSKSREEDIEALFGEWATPGHASEDVDKYPMGFLRDVIPVPCHSHNDYWRRVPVFSAIHAGCIGIEADVWLHGNELYVGHDTASLKPENTFQSLYISGLVKLLERQNAPTEFYNGSDHGIFDTDPSQTVVLLVDVKTRGEETWPVVLQQLEPLRQRNWLTHLEGSDGGQLRLRPITVVGSGNAPFSQIMSTSPANRYTFFDAPLSDLDSASFNLSNSYYASASFKSAIGEIKHGKLSTTQLSSIRSQVGSARIRGLKARYWDLPAWPIHVRNHIWDVLVQEGVDILNVDDLASATKKDWTRT